jgi:hypothetical protein
MRSAAVLLSNRRRAQRRTLRHVERARVRTPHRVNADASMPKRPARAAARRAPSRNVKPRERIIHIVPRGFLPLVRH